MFAEFLPVETGSPLQAKNKRRPFMTLAPHWVCVLLACCLQGHGKVKGPITTRQHLGLIQSAAVS